MKTFKTISLTAVCLVLGIIVAWQYRSVKMNQVLAQYEKKNVSEIIEELLIEKNNNENLKQRIQELQKEVDTFKAGETGVRENVEALERSVLAARVKAGLETVKGAGLIITIEAGGLKTVEDRHIEELINELKASDVQAISVNDERIVAMSEIRKAGDYIMVNGNQLVPPYTIKAIGQADNMERSLRLLGGVLEKFQYFEFKTTLKKEENVVIPAIREEYIKTDMLTPVVQ
ncbi:MAG: DUF881 domain-containing protein [Clostridiaceae bacterium]|jgi:uncharacterized protein YlxW (UPF0749 family)|nr:DUF881 domain-containing protein [Clostridiaceae bacterium]